MDKRFTEIIQLIKQARLKAIKAVNYELGDLHWEIGAYISRKIEKNGKLKVKMTENKEYKAANHNTKLFGFSGFRGLGSRSGIFVGVHVQSPKIQPLYIGKHYGTLKNKEEI